MQIIDDNCQAMDQRTENKLSQRKVHQFVQLDESRRFLSPMHRFSPEPPVSRVDGSCRPRA
jgi:hypothetical protein